MADTAIADGSRTENTLSDYHWQDNGTSSDAYLNCGLFIGASGSETFAGLYASNDYSEIANAGFYAPYLGSR